MPTPYDEHVQRLSSALAVLSALVSIFESSRSVSDPSTWMPTVRHPLVQIDQELHGRDTG